MLRRCGTDETGVVISRNSGIRRLDWGCHIVAAVSLCYGMIGGCASNGPQKTDVARMWDEYAEAHLGDLTSTTQVDDKKKVWPQLLGVAYTRKT